MRMARVLDLEASPLRVEMEELASIEPGAPVQQPPFSEDRTACRCGRRGDGAG
jgi:hypothetical protein